MGGRESGCFPLLPWRHISPGPATRRQLRRPGARWVTAASQSSRVRGQIGRRRSPWIREVPWPPSPPQRTGAGENISGLNPHVLMALCMFVCVLACVDPYVACCAWDVRDVVQIWICTFTHACVCVCRLGKAADCIQTVAVVPAPLHTHTQTRTHPHTHTQLPVPEYNQRARPGSVASLVIVL